MALKRSTQPAVEPVSLDEAKLVLRVDDDVEDTAIQGWITAAREECEARLQRTLITSGWTLKLDSFGSLCELPMAPTQGVTSISYVAQDGTSLEVDASSYVVDVDSDPARVQPLSSWPSTAGVFNAVTVVFTAGYGENASSVPQPIRSWILLAVGELYKNRERSVESQAIPLEFADRMLDPYKVWPK